MKNLFKKDYAYFVGACSRYLVYKEELEKNKFDFYNSSDKVYYKQIQEETKYVEEIFEKIKLEDEMLSKIMYLSLVEGRSFDTIGNINSPVGLSKRTIVNKYPKKSWKNIYDKLHT